MANTNGMYFGSMIDYSYVSAILGLYIGQVAFRYFGAGRLTTESYTAKGTFVYQMVFTCINIGLYLLPYYMNKALDTEKIPDWAEAVFMLAIPYLVFGFIMHYSLPRLTSRLVAYPATLAEEPVNEKLADPENQIKGKQASTFQTNHKVKIQLFC